MDGYCMPYIFARQFVDEFHHSVNSGMVATDHDSLTGHWATQGPNLYTAVRPHVRPDAPSDQLMEEYCQAFGPASGQVRDNFTYSED